MKVAEYNPESIPDLTGKIFFVTGGILTVLTMLMAGTAGLGKSSLLQLAKHNPSHLYFSGRSQAKADQVIKDVKAVADVQVTFVQCDLASLESVQTAAKEFAGATERLDILMCNAGIMAVPKGVTKDGYEIQFGTNHLGHALLIRLLLPLLEKTPESRIVSNTSLGYLGAPSEGIKYDSIKSEQDLGFAGRWIRYGQSKLANVLYSFELAKRYPTIKSIVIHPGVIKTELVSTLGFVDRAFVNVANIGNMITEEQGAFNQLWAATALDAKSGEFYEPVGQVGRRTKNLNEKAQTELWEWTEKELEKYLQ